MGSLSGISPNSPCKSTSQLGGSVRSEGEAAAQIMMVASLDAAADRPSAARARTLPPPPSPPAPPFMDTEAQHRSQPRRAPREGAEAGSVNEMDRDGSGLIDHERRLSEFQSSAADIFRRITGSREEFLAQCASLVRRTRYTGPEKEKAPRRQRPFAMGVDGPFLTRRGGADNEDRSSSEGDE